MTGRKVECAQSKHHGFHAEGEACPMCPVDEREECISTYTVDSSGKGRALSIDDIVAIASELGPAVRSANAALDRLHDAAEKTLRDAGVSQGVFPGPDDYTFEWRILTSTRKAPPSRS